MKTTITKRDEFADGSVIRYNFRVGRRNVGSLKYIVDEQRIEDLWILSQYRRRGYGTALMKAVLTDYGHKEITLSAEPENMSLRSLKAFYRKLGFVMDGPAIDGCAMMVRKGVKKRLDSKRR